MPMQPRPMTETGIPVLPRVIVFNQHLTRIFDTRRDQIAAKTKSTPRSHGEKQDRVFDLRRKSRSLPNQSHLKSGDHQATEYPLLLFSVIPCLRGVLLFLATRRTIEF